MTGLQLEICKLEDLPDPGSRAFRAGTGDWFLRGFVVRQGGQVHAYVNRCPHAGHPLDVVPGRFLNAERALIQCGSHGALFMIDTGYCVAGPCAGRGLTSLPVAVVAGAVVLQGDPDELANRFA